MDDHGRSDSYLLTLLSSASLDTFPDNTNTSFKVLLPTQLTNVSGVRLSKFSYPALARSEGYSFQQVIFNLEDYAVEQDIPITRQPSYYTSLHKRQKLRSNISDLLALFTKNAHYLSYALLLQKPAAIDLNMELHLTYFLNIKFSANRVNLYENMLKSMNLFDLYSKLVDETTYNSPSYQLSLMALYALWCTPFQKSEITYNASLVFINPPAPALFYEGNGYLTYLYPPKDGSRDDIINNLQHYGYTDRVSFNRFVHHPIPYNTYLDECLSLNPLIEGIPEHLLPNFFGGPDRGRIINSVMTNSVPRNTLVYGGRPYSGLEADTQPLTITPISTYPVFKYNCVNYYGLDTLDSDTPKSLAKVTNFTSTFNNIPFVSLIKPFKWVAAYPPKARAILPNGATELYHNESVYFSQPNDVIMFQGIPKPPAVAVIDPIPTPQVYFLGPTAAVHYFLTRTDVSISENNIFTGRAASTGVYNSILPRICLKDEGHLNTTRPYNPDSRTDRLYTDFGWDQEILVDQTTSGRFESKTFTSIDTPYVALLSQYASTNDLNNKNDWGLTFVSNYKGSTTNNCIGTFGPPIETSLFTEFAKYSQVDGGSTMFIYLPGTLSYNLFADTRAPNLDAIEYITPAINQLVSYEPSGSRNNTKLPAVSQFQQIQVDILDDKGRPFQLLRRSPLPTLLELELIFETKKTGGSHLTENRY